MKLLDQGAGDLVHFAFRFFQFIMAVTVVGLYATDLNAARKVNAYADGKWIFAVVTATLSAVTAVLYIIPFMLRISLIFIWDTILLLLWIAVFGLFGNMYIKEDAEGNGGVQRMKNAVWVDLTNLFLWLVSAVGVAFHWFKHRRTTTRWTERARV